MLGKALLPSTNDVRYVLKCLLVGPLKSNAFKVLDDSERGIQKSYLRAAVCCFACKLDEMPSAI